MDKELLDKENTELRKIIVQLNDLLDEVMKELRSYKKYYEETREEQDKTYWGI